MTYLNCIYQQLDPLNLRTICSLNIKREREGGCIKQCLKNFKWELRNWEQCFDHLAYFCFVLNTDSLEF